MSNVSWKISDVEMTEVLKGDQVVDFIPTAYFKVQGMP